MRFLFLLLLPVFGYSQFDTTLIYRQKVVHTLTYIDKCTTDWRIDTIPYHVPFEIKLSKTKISVDGYGDYKIVKTELRGTDQDKDKIKYYEIEGGGTFCFIYEIAIMEIPMKNNKSYTIVFELK